MTVQCRRIGGKKHEIHLNKTLIEYCKKGYNIIDLEGRSPTLIAVKQDKAMAVIVTAEKKPTYKKLREKYHMFDEILRVDYDTRLEGRKQAIQRVKKNLEDTYHKVIELKRKSPDGIVIRDDKVFAIEILGYTHFIDGRKMRNRKNWSWIEKQELYSMFDGLIIKTFFHNSPVVHTDFIPPLPLSTPVNLFRSGTYEQRGLLH